MTAAADIAAHPDDARHVHDALVLAARGPIVDPNPRVGCVVVAPDGQVVGRGWHAGAGTAHAEVVALREAGDAARGGTAYVTLEPCAHTGRTGPCARALVDAAVSRVVFAQTDPDLRARGGADVLRAAGVEVTGGVLAEEAAALNPYWTFAAQHERPYVTWKFAATLDGRSAAADGSSRWVSGPRSRADVHRLRSEVGAVLVGTGTVLADDPQLTARDDDGVASPRQPLRVVMGERQIPAGARVLGETAPTLHLPTRDPAIVLKSLHDKGIRRVLLEGGPTVGAAFLQTDLVDEVIAYIAAKLLGFGASAVGPLGVTTIDDAIELNLHDVRRLGDDVRLTYRRPRCSQA
ncbi:bifunctional diaminohydroxyphosphoribosylaminopyrimidine deaminase/5-amino-6-(5-phosphoribosylamino)uracil reductase RibD [Rudaeicoccus suwonensis]|uniref:Riboflavin biosynthesis protein RibD n=1 Tax=Rudaeicoccus suwonensis TaxID=657409 RepID=A0A561EAA5_9MICO|nr:bifunctional diaminohydroxyphosphoribosylaminopyrimidine deaminase/5-amino-6-(5-phosphoribosylamino)uracil reductase RibD [Rudaeicoccus suwonensis]TWE12542.1 diaminohydroxyphosphoribosylaminopyrimidine deaminase/5-amino-6-(5-phosphoribosylamino)uracil reductase [Rudaeicoccus suwonensis]